MTLLLGIAAPWGGWLSSDHRLTRWPGGQLITDMSIKHLGLKAADGEALLTYTGLGLVDDVDVSEWLRTVLRGENRGLEATVDHIASHASATLGNAAYRHRMLHVFIVSAFLRREPFLVAVANTKTPFNDPSFALDRTFHVTPLRVVDPVPVFAGAGIAAVSPEDKDLLRETSRRTPRRPADYLQLLAAVNRRTAESRRPGAKTVSAGCVVSCLSPTGGIQTQVFGDNGEQKKTQSPPYLTSGIDFTDVERTAPRWDPLRQTWFDRRTGAVVDPNDWRPDQVL